MIKAVLFDFGGVIAEEGFRKGLMVIAEKNGLDPVAFFRTADELIYSSGYLTGHADESAFLNAVREKTGIREGNDQIKDEILKRFVVRPEMLVIVNSIRSKGIITAILSDQTEWLDLLDKHFHFFKRFDHVFNSYKIHRSKRDSAVFRDICTALEIDPEEAIFIDDNENNVKRAPGEGLRTIHFRNTEDFQKEIQKYVRL
jgi:putative hydrolase of the HAD superfamily